jgi:hypothetical protein
MEVRKQREREKIKKTERRENKGIGLLYGTESCLRT